MNRFALIPLLILSAVSCQAGYVDIDQSSYSSDIFMSVTDNDSPGDQTVNAGDVITTVQLFNYVDVDSASKTALVISRVEVASKVGKLLTFGAESSPSLSSSLSNFTNSGGIGTLESTDASGTLSWVMLRADSTVSLSGSNFDFTAGDFGLTTSDWTIDATGTLVYQEYQGSGIVPDLTTQYPDGSTVLDGNSSGYQQRFGFDLLAVRDDADDTYTSGTPVADTTFSKYDSTTFTANIGTVATYGINYGFAGSSPTGTNFASSAVVVELADIGVVPEPSSLLVFGGFGLGLLKTRRRRRR